MAIFSNKISQKMLFFFSIFVVIVTFPLPKRASEPVNSNNIMINEDACKVVVSYLLYHEAAALSFVNKFFNGCVNKMFSSRNDIINEFNKRYPLKDNKKISVKHKTEEDQKEYDIIISANSLMFNLLGDHVRGYSLEKRPSGYDMGKHYCKHVTLSYPALEIQKIEDVELLSEHGYVAAITNKNRTVSLLISRELGEWKWEHRTICGLANTWNSTSSPIQLQGTVTKIGTDYELHLSDNLIIATFICRSYDKKPDVPIWMCECYEEAHTYIIGNEKGSLFIAERNDLTDGEFVLINLPKPLSQFPFRKRPTSKTKAYWNPCNLI